MSGRTHSEESLKKMSGENNHMFGKTHSEELWVKICQSMSEARLGISQSEQHKAARATAMLGKNKGANSALSIKIEVFDKETNKSSSFGSMREAARALNF
jgi:hypothetical protein